MATWELNGVKFANDTEAKAGCELYDSLVGLFGKEKANAKWPNVWSEVQKSSKSFANMRFSDGVTGKIITKGNE